MSSSHYRVDTDGAIRPDPFLRVTETKEDPVNHPKHYGGFSNNAQVIDITENLSFNGGNAVKYVSRSTRQDGHNKDNPIQDLEKARWYIDREIERLKKEEADKRYKEYESRLEAMIREATNPYISPLPF